jgi:hypothetical protein
MAEGGFISPNTQVDVSVYPDDVTRRAAQALIDAGDSVRYDMSDLQPTEFGATTGQGIWGILIDFLQNPDDVDGPGPRSRAASRLADIHSREVRGTSRHGTPLSTRTSPGRPRTRSPRMVFITSVVPPSIELARLRRNACCKVADSSA